MSRFDRTPGGINYGDIEAIKAGELAVAYRRFTGVPLMVSHAVFSAVANGGGDTSGLQLLGSLACYGGPAAGGMA